jgi:hypothetical protein
VASAEGGERGLPRILVMITGKGPLRDMYMGKVQKAQDAWDFVRCVSAWLDAADYPLLLGSVFPFSTDEYDIDLQHRFRRHWNVSP